MTPPNLHVTLKFLGAVEEPRMPDVERALGEAAAGVTAFDLTLRGLGAFPSVARPRVIWAGATEGAPALAGVAASVERALSPLGFPTEARPFSAHVTLGRVRTPRRNPKLADALAAAAAIDLARMRVTHLSLMRSDLSPRGARYTELSSYAIV